MTPVLYNWGLRKRIDTQKTFKADSSSIPNVILENEDLDDEEENNYIEKMLNVSGDEDPLDAFPKALLGEKATQDYYSHYKK